MRDTVLIIDDDPNLRELLTEIGNMAGVRTVEAANCCDGLEVLDKEISRVKLVFMDYFMPGLTPKQCVSALREKIKDEQIPIVLLTAAVDPAERAAELELRHWVGKPFEIEKLERMFTSDHF